MIGWNFIEKWQSIIFKNFICIFSLKRQVSVVEKLMLIFDTFYVLSPLLY